MEPFRSFSAAAAPLDQSNVDTDQIIPARFLLRPRADGYGELLFHDLRFSADGSERPEFVLNRAPFRSAGILVAAENFGCGSAREQAPWALADFGIRCIVAASFGDIFYNNCIKNGLLPIVLPVETVTDLRQALHASNDPQLAVDLERQEIAGPAGRVIRFTLDPGLRHRLLHGIDDIDVTSDYASAIERFEKENAAERQRAGLEIAPTRPAP